MHICICIYKCIYVYIYCVCMYVCLFPIANNSYRCKDPESINDTNLMDYVLLDKIIFFVMQKCPAFLVGSPPD